MSQSNGEIVSGTSTRLPSLPGRRHRMHPSLGSGVSTLRLSMRPGANASPAAMAAVPPRRSTVPRSCSPGRCRPTADAVTCSSLCRPAPTGATVQEIHHCLVHALCLALDEALGPTGHGATVILARSDR
jgi:hypothetical protein